MVFLSEYYPFDLFHLLVIYKSNCSQPVFLILLNIDIRK